MCIGLIPGLLGSLGINLGRVLFTGVNLFVCFFFLVVQISVNYLQYSKRVVDI